MRCALLCLSVLGGVMAVCHTPCACGHHGRCRRNYLLSYRPTSVGALVLGSYLSPSVSESSLANSPGFMNSSRMERCNSPSRTLSRSRSTTISTSSLPATTRRWPRPIFSGPKQGANPRRRWGSPIRRALFRRHRQQRGRRRRWRGRGRSLRRRRPNRLQRCGGIRPGGGVQLRLESEHHTPRDHHRPRCPRGHDPQQHLFRFVGTVTPDRHQLRH